MDIYLWLIHVDIWQKPIQYHKAIIQLNTFLKRKSVNGQNLTTYTKIIFK